MKKSWMVAGLGVVAVVAVGVFVLTTKNTNDTKRGDDSATGNEETVKQTEMDSSVNFVPSSVAGGEKEWLAGYAEENLSAPVLALLGLDGKLHDYNSLLSAIALLPKGNIAADDVAALRDSPGSARALRQKWLNQQFIKARGHILTFNIDGAG